MDENIKKFPGETEDTRAEETERNTEAKAQAETTSEKTVSPEEQRERARSAVNEAAYGKFLLDVPFMSDDHEITELEYDFRALTGVEYANAMDSSNNSKGADAFHLTDRQALALFAAAAAKKTKHVDKDDVLRGLSITDSIKVIQITTIFFVLSSRAGNLRIMKK